MGPNRDRPKLSIQIETISYPKATLPSKNCDGVNVSKLDYCNWINCEICAQFRLFRPIQLSHRSSVCINNLRCSRLPISLNFSIPHLELRMNAISLTSGVSFA